MSLTIEIKQTNGKWLINGKQYKDCTFAEQKFFHEFLNSFKYDE